VGDTNPYVVVMFGNAKQAAQDAKEIGADAISAYAVSVEKEEPSAV
jgi:hypothetical protein